MCYRAAMTGRTSDTPAWCPPEGSPAPHPSGRLRLALGDFNYRLNQPGDRVWADLDDGEPANADLTALTQDMPVSCRDHTFTEFIDHLVSSSFTATNCPPEFNNCIATKTAAKWWTCTSVRAAKHRKSQP
jgi:hypothetical protein